MATELEILSRRISTLEQIISVLSKNVASTFVQISTDIEGMAPILLEHSHEDGKVVYDKEKVTKAVNEAIAEMAASLKEGSIFVDKQGNVRTQAEKDAQEGIPTPASKMVQ